MIFVWIIYLKTKSVIAIYIARFIGGSAMGLGSVLVPLYLGEISSNKIRGSLLVMCSVFTKIGFVYVFAIGSYVSIPTMAWIGLIPPVGFLLGFYWLPESPYYLMGKGKEKNARQNLKKIKNRDTIDDELEHIKEVILISNDRKGSLKEFCSIGNRRGLIILIGLATAQQFSGSTTMLLYAPTIFKSININVDPRISSIMLTVIQLVTAIIALYTIDKLGRRILLLFSVIGVALLNAIVSLYFFLSRIEIKINFFDWIAFFSLLGIMFCYIIGLGTVPHTLLGEIFPKHLKAFSGATFICYIGVVQFIVKKLFQVILDGVGPDVVFLSFAIMSILAVPFVWFVVPETKGRPLADILIELQRTKNDGKIIG